MQVNVHKPIPPTQFSGRPCTPLPLSALTFRVHHAFKHSYTLSQVRIGTLAGLRLDRPDLHKHVSSFTWCTVGITWQHAGTCGTPSGKSQTIQVRSEKMSPAPPTPSHIFADHDNRSRSFLGATALFASDCPHLGLPCEHLINCKEAAQRPEIPEPPEPRLPPRSLNLAHSYTPNQRAKINPNVLPVLGKPRTLCHGRR